MNKQHAFSLIELMVTLAVFGITLMIAVPSFISLSNSNRAVSDTNSLVGALNFARSEAAKRGSTVSVCTSGDGQNCSNGAGWDSGWIVFIDNGTLDQVDTGDTILRVYGKLSAANNISASTALANYLTYNSDGFSNNQGQFVLCENSDTSSARAISVARTGRISLKTTGVGTCTAP